jgi:hypothetical protein
MKRLLLLLFSFTLFAQDYGNDTKALELCTTLQSNSFSSDLDADNALDRILSVVGLSKNFVLSPCSDINNAVAVSYKGVRYILYDPQFMSMLSSNTSNWTNIFILAHEVGHHVNGHSLDLVLYAGDIVDAPELEKKRQQELEADEFAGFVLAKLGASLSQTTSSVSELSNEDDTYSTHPKRDKRVSSIRKGWHKSNSNITSSNEPDNKHQNLEKSKAEKINSWIVKPNHPLLLADYYVNEYPDPADKKSIYSEFPIKQKTSASTGTSLSNPEKKIELYIIQKKYKYIENKQQYRRIRAGANLSLEKDFAYKEFEISISGMEEAPKYVTEYYKEREENIPENIRELNWIVGKVQLTVDEIFSSSFLAYFGHYGFGEISDIEVDWIAGHDLNRTINESHLLFLEFFEALKKGNKLYLRFSPEIQTEEYGGVLSEWYYDPLFDIHTYEFNLSGSSSALKFD